MSVVGNVTIQTLYTIAGLDNPLIVEPALKRQVEHRSGELSRRGFLGLTAAGAAGLVAGSVFDPVTKLWTPAVKAGVELVEQGVAVADRTLLFWAQLLANRADERIVIMTNGLRTERAYHHEANMHATATGRPEDLNPNALWWEADGVNHVAPFNEHVPMPVHPVERDPNVRVADVLSKRHMLCRAIAYDQWNGLRHEPTIELRIVGRYVPKEQMRSERKRRDEYLWRG